MKACAGGTKLRTWTAMRPPLPAPKPPKLALPPAAESEERLPTSSSVEALMKIVPPLLPPTSTVLAQLG